MDKQAEFLELIERYKRVVYKVCCIYAPDREQVNDYFQEVVLALWNGFDRFRGDSSAATWVYRVSLYTCISFVRRRMRRPAQVCLQFDPAMEDGYDLRERLDQMYAAIDCLGPIDKALVLLWLEERPNEEIAVVTGLKPGTVAVRMTRIREKLRKLCKN